MQPGRQKMRRRQGRFYIATCVVNHSAQLRSLLPLMKLSAAGHADQRSERQPASIVPDDAEELVDGSPYFGKLARNSASIFRRSSRVF